VVARAFSRGLARSPRAEGRMVPSGGVAIAFLGCDGSGKSTLLVETTAWLSGSLRTVPIYFGSGVGPSSLLRWPLLEAERLLRKRVPSVRDRPWRRSTGLTSSLRGRLSRVLWAAARLVWAMALAYEKRGKLHALTRARNRGLVVVCDRYPQNQFQDFNDGPMLRSWRDHPWRLLRAVAEWEGTPYRWAEHVVPDLVLKLHVRPDVAQQRKPDMQLQDLEKRAEAIRCLRFPDVTETVDIDAEEPWSRSCAGSDGASGGRYEYETRVGRHRVCWVGRRGEVNALPPGRRDPATAGMARRAAHLFGGSRDARLATAAAQTPAVTAEAIFHPAGAVRSLKAILATRQASAADVIRLTVNWLFMSSLLRKTDCRTGVHIFDEGQLNALWSIGFSARSAGTAGILAELARQRSTPVVVALIEADIAAVRARLDLRKNGQSRLERTGPTDDAWKRARQALQQVKATLQMLTNEGADIQVVAVRNRGREDLDALANSLAAAFEECLGSPAPRPTAAGLVERASETGRPAS